MRGTRESANDATMATAIGRRLKDKRTQLRLTLAQVADRAAMSVAQLSRLESGQGNPRLSTISRAIEALDMPRGILFSDEGTARTPDDPCDDILVIPRHGLFIRAPSSDKDSSGAPCANKTHMLIDWEKLNV